MMKRLLIIGLLLITSAQAQILDPVKWSFRVEKTGPDEALLTASARIDKNWHLYSQFIEEGGPIPTSFSFEDHPSYKKLGKVTEKGKLSDVFDPVFSMQLKYFSEQVTFTQKVKVLQPKLVAKGFLEFMVCDEKQCLPPEEVPFSFEEVGFTPGGAKTDAADTSAALAVAIPDSLATSFPDTPSAQVDASTVEEPAAEPASFWGIFIAGFLGGLLALLTPCVFPMIPMTVSFFTKQSGNRAQGIFKAVIYGISIIVIYVGLGMLVTLLFGADALNALASDIWFNLAFFVLLVVFGASFLGAFEITLPASWVNKADQQSDRGGLIGIFFMAFTLSLVSFSCTGPIIGTLLVEAAVGSSYLGPAIGMTGFSLALALPFTLFAIFPGWLKSLPKSGGWLNSVKVVLGFLELAFALKFLSNVDLAYHWGVLDREVFLVLWIAIFLLLSLYLIGTIRFSHDSPLQYLTIPRLFFAIAAFSFTIYLIPGLWGAPLKAVNAFLPPMATQDFDLSRYQGGGGGDVHAQSSSSGEKKKYGELFHCPHGIDCFFDLEQGLAYAKKVNKPVMIDFTGHSCVNCRKMEASVWVDPTVLRMLKNDYVLISLYVDDKTPLPAEEQYVSRFSGKKIKSVGNKWSDLQASTFNINSQPYYVLMDHNQKPLVPPQAFNLDISNYQEFLKSGLEVFRKQQP